MPSGITMIHVQRMIKNKEMVFLMHQTLKMRHVQIHQHTVSTCSLNKENITLLIGGCLTVEKMKYEKRHQDIKTELLCKMQG